MWELQLPHREAVRQEARTYISVRMNVGCIQADYLHVRLGLKER
jgi:hypothetical protein